MYNPVSTYRIQFNKDYTLRAFKDDLRYFFLLSPGSFYASPIFEAAPGSMHGYDVTNPLSFNHEIGSYKEFTGITRELKAGKIGWIQDIVPNHMAFHMDNIWLMDVLENGLSSKYSDLFDIDFSHPGYNGKLMIPFLGKQLREAIADNEITVDWRNGNFIFRYSDYYFPFNSDTFGQIVIKHLASAPKAFHKIWYDLALGFKEEFLEKEWPDLKERIQKLYIRTASFRTFINNIIESANNDNQLIGELLNQQHYQLTYWTESVRSINYRRFFTVNSLICLKMENDNVFDIYHGFIKEQIDGKKFQGLRIDHIDGLRNPVHYLEKLRVLSGEETYIISEKILGKDEELLHDLPIQGTSGYDYSSYVNNLFTWKKNALILEKYYRRITGIKDETDDIIYEKKKFILFHHMHGELENLTRMFDEAGFVIYDSVITRESVKQSIAEFLILFPVYKLYSDFFPLSSGDSTIIEDVFVKAIKRNPSIGKSLKVLEDVLVTQSGFERGKKDKALDFYLRCMQYTGPLMAKGVEDTVMYYYNSFIAHNEVGDHPGSNGITVQEFHDKMIKRQQYRPLSMNATSTHDTKRGEDVRARLNVISEFAEEWMKNVDIWISVNSKFKTLLNGRESPSVNEEYFIYQTLTGVFPFEGRTDDAFLERMDEYIIKSLRESKTNTDWNEPDEGHEKAVINFTRKILAPESEFMVSFIPFQKKISEFGIINSLTQLMLKATTPGIPDFYQGTELWDLSMVDPDNRRPVNFRKRLQWLGKLIENDRNDPENSFAELYSNRRDGRIKLWLTWQLMQERKSEPDLFLYGNYVPLPVTGKYREHVIAFARNHKNKWLIVIAPLFLSVIMREQDGFSWEDTGIEVPDIAPGKWSSPYGEFIISGREILLSDVMKVPGPVYIKGKTEEPVRSAGILTHISSLPGKYGTGDLGEAAYEFADYLRASGQSYWQVLPFNPIDKSYGYSPYSSTSAFAGNIVFLDPDQLLKSRLVNESSLKVKFPESNRSNFKKAADFRADLLEEAYNNYRNFSRPLRNKRYNDFCEKEQYWLDDYALFINLKKEFKGVPWNKWPEAIKNREEDKLNALRKKYQSEIEKEKLGQYLFSVQWDKLKTYANNSGIKIIGDMSIYVNYDSADVWSEPAFFKLDDKKNPTMVAGVPPDYFSKTGQLWNMPVYDWESMKENGYDWWMRRIRRNLELCDIVRFDHFRGFSEYWEVPAGEKTAINGKWTAGPGSDFFEKVKNEFPGMPFIAEDLGHIDDKVYKLRDNYSLPGMVVLQFAFGDNTPHSIYIPHNHTNNSIVYTGTHDNNTTKGWYMNELNDKNRKEAEEYSGHKINNDSCHTDFIRMAYGSVARIAIIPVQDLLGFGEDARLNKPSESHDNWDWKLKNQDLKKTEPEKVRKMVRLFGRY
jgi:malto-oligosyltrehalose synthase/4-alpha-glucanotransferase